MSLLNQVLTDLDARETPASRPALRTAGPAVSRHAADDFDTRDNRAWLRAGSLGLLVLGMLLAAWGLYRTTLMPDLASPESRPLTLPPDVQPAAVPAPTTPATESEAVVAEAAAPLQPESSAHAPPAAAAPPLEPPDGGFLPLRNVTMPAPEPEPVPPRARTPKPPPSKTIRPAPVDPLERARQAIAGGALAEAEAVLRERLAAHSDDRLARELLVGLLLRGERTADALREIDTGLALHPKNGNFVLIKARLLAQAGERDAAVALLQRHARTPGIAAQRLQMLGALNQQAGHYAQAAEHYRALLAVQPNSAAGWVGLAITRDALGEGDAARAYRRALQLGGLPAAAEAYARQRLAELE